MTIEETTKQNYFSCHIGMSYEKFCEVQSANGIKTIRTELIFQC